MRARWAIFSTLASRQEDALDSETSLTFAANRSNPRSRISREIEGPSNRDSSDDLRASSQLGIIGATGR